jgi:hypothetical protein
MIKRSFRAASVSLSLLLLSSLSSESLAQSGPRKQPPTSLPDKGTVLFELTNYGNIPTLFPLVIMRGGRYIAPPAFRMKAARRQFAETYYRPGQTYNLLSGGSDIGTVVVKSLNQCDAMAATVEPQTSEEIINQRNYLVTNSDSLAGKSARQRAPTAAEETAIMNLVRPMFRRRRLPTPFLEGVANQLKAADLNGDGRAELIGFFASGTKSQHSVFIIAEPRGGRFKPTLVLLHQSRDKWGDDGRYLSFVDAMDLDGDGLTEVIVAGDDPRSTNDWSYLIYKKQGGRWRNIYVGGGLKCASEMGGEVS